MYVVGPFVGTQEAGATFWRPPAGHVGAALDLSPQASARIWDPTLEYQPIGLFNMPSDWQVPSDYRAWADLDSSLTNADVDFLLLCGGKRAVGLTLREWIRRALCDWSAPDDREGKSIKTLLPPISQTWEIFVGVERLSGPVDRRNGYWSRIKRLHQLDMVTAAESDHIHAGKWLATLCSKYGMTVAEFIAGEPRLSGMQPRKPSTTHTWDGTLNGWTSAGGQSFEVSGSGVRKTTTNGTYGAIRYDTALSSADHRARCTFNGVGGRPNGTAATGGIMVRMQSGGSPPFTGYAFIRQWHGPDQGAETTGHVLGKWTDGSWGGILGSWWSSDATNPSYVDMGISGSSLTGKGDFTNPGTTTRCTATDTSISAGSYWGLGHVYKPTSDLYYVSHEGMSASDDGFLTNYTMPADHGVFSLSGQAVGLLAGRSLSAGNGSFALAGQNVGLLAARSLSVNHGAFALAGQDVGLLAARRLSVDHGAFALSGQDVDLIYDPAEARKGSIMLGFGLGVM